MTVSLSKLGQFAQWGLRIPCSPGSHPPWSPVRLWGCLPMPFCHSRLIEGPFAAAQYFSCARLQRTGPHGGTCGMGEPQGLPPAVVPEVLLPLPTPDPPLPLVQHLCGGECPSHLPIYLPTSCLGPGGPFTQGPAVGMRPLPGLLKIKGSSNSQPFLVTHTGQCLCACTCLGRLALSCTGADMQGCICIYAGSGQPRGGNTPLLPRAH